MDHSGNKNQDNELELLSLNAARKEMHIRPETLKRLIVDGKIRAKVINGRYKIPRVSLREDLCRSAVDKLEKFESKNIQSIMESLIEKYT